ncbi:hypothetical protein CBM2623_A80127 [Cupriavidus taiwanensis]|nr:hypothetical protein CBM2623_A80127 [Cupriavidus taiwanensis]
MPSRSRASGSGCGRMAWRRPGLPGRRRFCIEICLAIAFQAEFADHCAEIPVRHLSCA